MSLEDCEKFYLEEFRKLLLEKNFKYPKILTYFDKKDYSNYPEIVKIKDYLLPYENINFFTFNYPIITPCTNNKLNKFYKLFNIGDKILIWKTGQLAEHLSCQIITNNGYTFSFGLNQGNMTYKEQTLLFNVNSSLIITPDYALEKYLLKKILDPSEKNIKLIAISYLNKKLLDILNDKFNNIRIMNKYNVIPKIINDPKNSNNNKNEELLNLLISLKLTNQTNQYTIDLLNNNKNNKIFFLQYYYYEITDRYCMFSKHRNKTINCSSFMQSLFDDIISCTGSSIVSIPRFCYQKKTSKRVTCPKVVNNTSRKTKTLI